MKGTIKCYKQFKGEFKMCVCMCVYIYISLRTVFLPGESQGQGSLVGCHLWGHTESDTTEVMQQQLGL